MPKKRLRSVTEADPEIRKAPRRAVRKGPPSLSTDSLTVNSTGDLENDATSSTQRKGPAATATVKTGSDVMEGIPKKLMKKTTTDFDTTGRKTPAEPKVKADRATSRETSAEGSKKNYFLMKSEPESRYENGIDMKFSFTDLKECPNQTEHWDGVRNYQARNILKSMHCNDEAFFYHSNCSTAGIVGVVQIVKEAYPDHTQFDSQHPHYDPKSKSDDPKWIMVDVKYVRTLPRPISLKELKLLKDRLDCPPGIRSLDLLSRGRLSVQRLTAEQWSAILHLAEST